MRSYDALQPPEVYPAGTMMGWVAHERALTLGGRKLRELSHWERASHGLVVREYPSGTDCYCSIARNGHEEGGLPLSSEQAAIRVIARVLP